MRMTLIRLRRLARQRGWWLHQCLRLMIICLVAVAIVFVWEALEADGQKTTPLAGVARQPVAEASPVVDAPRKFEDRTRIAVVAAEALERLGADVSHLQAVELGAPYTSIDGTTLLRNGKRLRIDAIEGPRAADICVDDQGLRWACGLQARAALHNVLAGAVLTCMPRLALGDGDMTVSCLVKPSSPGGVARDMATELVVRGWARPLATTDIGLGSALDRARAAKAGLWRGNWALAPTPDHN